MRFKLDMPTSARPPNPRNCDVIHVAVYGKSNGFRRSPAFYLHEVRTNRLQGVDPEARLELDAQYAHELAKLASNLASQTAGLPVDLIVQAPSAHGDLIAPYFNACTGAHTSAQSWPTALSKQAGVRSGDPATTVDQLYAAISLSAASNCTVSSRLRVLLVDDVFAGGKTAAAVLVRLENDLNVDVDLTIAVALVIA